MTTNEVAPVAGRKTLIAAAVVTGVTAVGLVWAGWLVAGTDPGWDRLLSADYWFGGVLRGIGVLLLGKTGLKIGLVLVGAVVAAVMWMRRR